MYEDWLARQVFPLYQPESRGLTGAYDLANAFRSGEEKELPYLTYYVQDEEDDGGRGLEMRRLSVMTEIWTAEGGFELAEVQGEDIADAMVTLRSRREGRYAIINVYNQSATKRVTDDADIPVLTLTTSFLVQRLPKEPPPDESPDGEEDENGGS